MHVVRMHVLCMLVLSMCYMLVYCQPSYFMLLGHVDFIMTSGWIVACFALA